MRYILNIAASVLDYANLVSFQLIKTELITLLTTTNQRNIQLDALVLINVT